MRSTPLWFALAVVAGGLFAPPAPAQFGFTPKAKIDAPRIGFRPSGGGEKDYGAAATPVCKVGTWAPVSFAIEFLDIGSYTGGILLEVTTADCDNLRTVTRYPVVPATTAEPGTDEFLLERGKGIRRERTEIPATAYVRVAGDSYDVTLRLVEEGNPDRSLSDSVILQSQARAASKYVILSLGASAPVEFRSPDRGRNPNDADVYLRGGRVELARIDTVQEMPDQWFGYEAADLVFLGTGRPDRQFLTDLFVSGSEQFARKRRALIEWVRRGGKLVLSAGNNADVVAASPDFAAILPVAVRPASRVQELWLEPHGVATSRVRIAYPERAFDATAKKLAVQIMSGLTAAALPDKLPPDLFPLAELKPTARNTPFAPLLRRGTKASSPDDPPAVVQGPLGLGRVTVVGFDLDRSPFADRGNTVARRDFWDWLVDEAGDKAAARAILAAGGNATGGGLTSTPLPSDTPPEDGGAAALRANVDHYDEVPVISFGWVALFILGYTLIIGPLEYVLLKKLFGRLELTWITFPIIVLTVSGAAYFTAYAVKGKDLRMNKIDVVDVDLRADKPRVYGRSWFTIFSPRIDTYTVGIEPKENWAGRRDEQGYTPVTTVDWFGQPKPGGVTASNRGYRYVIDPRGDNSPEANGLTGVPIPVWSTKAFAANWSGVPDESNPPAVSTLVRTRDTRDVIGGEVQFNITLTDVQEAFAVYRGQVYAIDTVVSPDVPLAFRTGALQKPVAKSPFQNDNRFFYQDNDAQPTGQPFGRRPTVQPTAAANMQEPLELWGLLFHQQASGVSDPQNASLRLLDQSWRLTDDNDAEVILLFKLKRTKGPAEELMSKPESASPSRVWLHGLPGRDTRETVLGVLQQDTYIRMYLPVKPVGAK